MNRSKPLHRKVNSKALNSRHGTGMRASFERGTKRVASASMHRGQRHGLDYTPLYRFLLSKLGESWETVHAEAVARLDREEPIWHLVARNTKEERSIVRIGEATYFSGLKIDDAGNLAMVDPSITLERLTPRCGCCTHSFNGRTFTRVYDPDNPFQPLLSDA